MDEFTINKKEAKELHNTLLFVEELFEDEQIKGYMQKRRNMIQEMSDYLDMITLKLEENDSNALVVSVNEKLPQEEIKEIAKEYGHIPEDIKAMTIEELSDTVEGLLKYQEHFEATVKTLKGRVGLLQKLEMFMSIED